MNAITKTRGRKANKSRQNIIDNIFRKSAGREQFVETIQAQMDITENTAVSYWYSLCKATGRKENMRRGPAPIVKPNYEVMYNEVIAKVREQMEIAKAGKKSVVPFKAILGE